MKKVFLILGLILLSSYAIANDCDDSKLEGEMYACIKNKLVEQNEIMNIIYDTLISKYKKDGAWPLSNIS